MKTLLYNKSICPAPVPRPERFTLNKVTAQCMANDALGGMCQAAYAGRADVSALSPARVRRALARLRPVRATLTAEQRRQALLNALPFLESGRRVAEAVAAGGISKTTFCKLLKLAPTHRGERLHTLGKVRRLLVLPTARLAPKRTAGRASL